MQNIQKDLEYLTTIYVKSSDRNIGDPSNNFTLNYLNGLIGVDYIAVNHVSLFSNLYQINQSNRYFYFRYDVITTQPMSLYVADLYKTSFNDGPSYASALQSQMRIATGTATISVNYDPTTGKITLSSTDLTKKFGVNMNATRDLYNHAYYNGFALDTKDGQSLYPVNPLNSSNPLTAPFPVLFKSTQYLDFCSSELTKHQHNTVSLGGNPFLPSKILFRYHIQYTTLNTIQDFPVRELYLINWKNNQLLGGFVDFQVRDEFGNIAELENSTYNLEIICYKKKTLC